MKQCYKGWTLCWRTCWDVGFNLESLKAVRRLLGMTNAKSTSMLLHYLHAPILKLLAQTLYSAWKPWGLELMHTQHGEQGPPSYVCWTQSHMTTPRIHPKWLGCRSFEAHTVRPDVKVTDTSGDSQNSCVHALKNQGYFWQFGGELINIRKNCFQ